MLARLEARVALDVFLDRVKEVALVDDEFKGVEVFWAHGPATLLANIVGN
jgi:cytochrome P450